MQNLRLYIKVGLFSTMSVIMTLGMFIFLNPELFDTATYHTHSTRILNAAGINKKTSVKSNGIAVGRVTDLRLGVDYTELTFEVDADVKIPEGSYVRVVSKGLLGDSFINIEPAKDRGVHIPNKAAIPEARDGFDMTKLADMIGKVGEDFQEIMASFSEAYGGEDGEREIREIVDNIEEATENLRNSLESTRKSSRTFVDNLSQALDAESKEQIDQMIANLDESLEEFLGTARNVKLASAQIKRGDGFMGQLISEDESLTQLEDAVTAFRKVLNPSTRLKLEVDTHMESRADETSQGYFDLKLHPRPDRYFLFGITALEAEEREEYTENLGENEDGEGKRTRVKKEEELKFNVQFAQRIYYTALRFGIFEGSVGFATDLYLFSNRLRASIEAWDWQFSKNNVRRVAHLKSYLSILFFNHVYLMTGIDDPLKYKNEGDTSEFQDTNLFFGAGLRFDDRDLRALFGAATIGGAASN